MNLCSIASGSSGNCIYVGSHNTHVMIDAGISKKRIEQGLNSIGLKASEIDGILITHEHSDHVSGLGIFSKKFNVPVYANLETWNAMAKQKEKIEAARSIATLQRAQVQNERLKLHARKEAGAVHTALKRLKQQVYEEIGKNHPEVAKEIIKIANDIEKETEK